MPWVALIAIVNFSYTGKIMLAGSTVVAIIKAANLLQVGAVERAAVDFLVERLDAGNVLDAMALGSHLSAGEIGRDLRDRSRGWLNRNLGLIVAEPAFMALPAAEVAELVEVMEKAEEVKEVEKWSGKGSMRFDGVISACLPSQFISLRDVWTADAPHLWG